MPAILEVTSIDLISDLSNLSFYSMRFSSTTSSLSPFQIQATIETIYPVPEATAMGILFLGLNVTAIVFTLSMEKLKDPKTGSMALSLWVVVGLSALGAILVLFFKGDYRRLAYEQAFKEGKTPLSVEPPNGSDPGASLDISIATQLRSANSPMLKKFYPSVRSPRVSRTPSAIRSTRSALITPAMKRRNSFHEINIHVDKGNNNNNNSSSTETSSLLSNRGSAHNSINNYSGL